MLGMIHVNIGAILGTFSFFAIIVFFVAEFLNLSAKVAKILKAILPSEPTQVDATLDQMYGGGRGSEAQYAATRNAAQAAKNQQQKRGRRNG